MNRIALIALISVGFLSGCASGPKMAEIKDKIPPIATGKGRIYFYRDNNMVGAAVQPNIRVNEEVVGSSKPGGFFFVDRQPGNYTVATSTEVTRSTHVALEAGKKKYIKTSISMGLFVGHVTPNEITEAQGELDLNGLAYTGDPTLLLAPNQTPIQSKAIASAELIVNTQQASRMPVAPQAEMPAPSTVATLTPLDAAPRSEPAPPPVVSYSIKDRKLGTWSYEAEQFANSKGCKSGSSGAWLIGKADYVEHYQVACIDGNKFTAVCDQVACQAG
ncbi:DUF2846 domain-containing protein [Chitinimonas sp. BJYL2]|uniref:DUF2846 domain-containing protein n=1 Tax=Chitinimonas sp. BJYL2 TaxID=2976696 RepID=UPI0022B57E48|nr:DUF2846 domain-containing protein [Chitinimonas sp. BJYL2]